MTEGSQSEDGADPAALSDRLRLHARAVQRLQLAMAKAMGLSPTDVWALEILLSEGPLGPVELGTRLGIRSASATTLVDRLEQAGHVERLRHPADRRRLVVQPTDHATAAAGTTFAPLFRALIAAAEDFTPEERAAIARYLDRVTQVLTDYAEDQGV
jgi:DNA-binding MarR family transcriptional regulator